MASRIDSAWHKAQVLKYRQQEPAYRVYANTLKDVLKKACELYAPTAIVDSRAKSIASFAEKAARKADTYDDPVHQLTDLCGARVIANTAEELAAICQFIRDHMHIDEANSSDTSSRLDEDEFGYRSIHYIVQLDAPEILGVDIPADVIGCRKAEIQVRTVAQHAWANITHDRLYKSSFKVPSSLKRRAHRSAALLEEADIALNDFAERVQDYLGSYTSYLKPDELAQEIDVMQLVLDSEPNPASKPAIALRLARMQRAARHLDHAINTLEQYATVPGSSQLAMLVELGSALAERDQPGDAQRARVVLTQAAQPVLDSTGRQRMTTANDRKLRAWALSCLATVEGPHQRRSLYSSALQQDPHDPYILCSQLAHNLITTSQRIVLDSARPAMMRAIEKCREHIAAGLQLPRAWITKARLFLMLRETSGALESYAKAIHFYLADTALAWPERDFISEMDFFAQLRAAHDEPLPEVLWCEQLLRLGKWMKDGRQRPIAHAVGRPVKYSDIPVAQPILIVTGGSEPAVRQRVEQHFDLLLATLDGFRGVVISGGTEIGVPGLVGRAAAELHALGRKGFTLIGYHPPQLPADVRPSCHYDHLVCSDSSDASGYGESLQVWVDLLAAEVNPTNVRVLGINGGSISLFEDLLALSLGALVGLIESSERSADELLKDPDWSKLPTLLPLPNDPMTAQAFAQVGSAELSEDELERLGILVHETYRKGTKPNFKQPNTLPWEVLPEYFKQSSCEQAAYAFHMLRCLGFDIERVNAPATTPITIPEQLVPLLAEREHGRWNFERLRSGWRRASTKDNDAKHSPYLVAWSELPESVRKYDVEAVKNFPALLAAGGYQLRLPAHRQ